MDGSQAAYDHDEWAPGWLLSLAGLITTMTVVMSLCLQRSIRLGRAREELGNRREPKGTVVGEKM